MSIKSVALAIADNIEEAGHYQGGDKEEKLPWPSGPRMCVLANPAYQQADSDTVYFRGALTAKIGFRAITSWNDATPTVEVLRTLREIAEENP